MSDSRVGESLTDFLSVGFGRVLAKDAESLTPIEAYSLGVVSHRLDYAFRAIKTIDKGTKCSDLLGCDFSYELKLMEELLGLSYEELVLIYDKIKSEYSGEPFYYTNI